MRLPVAARTAADPVAASTTQIAPDRVTITAARAVRRRWWMAVHLEVRGHVSRTFNTTGPDRNGSRTKNGNDDAASGLRATTKSSTPRP